MAEANPRFDAESFTRPDRVLLKYYMLASLVWGPLFPIALIILIFRYKTLTYQIEPTRISVSWGKLVHRRVSLSYERVQDIQLRRNFFERQLGLARIEIQTASGDANAEITLEGVTDYEAMRTYLWSKVLEAQRRGDHASRDKAPHGEPDELVEALRAVTEELRAIRTLLSPPREDTAEGTGEPVEAEEPAS
jgi:putative membrane protein